MVVGVNDVADDVVTLEEDATTDEEPCSDDVDAVLIVDVDELSPEEDVDTVTVDEGDEDVLVAAVDVDVEETDADVEVPCEAADELTDDNDDDTELIPTPICTVVVETEAITFLFLLLVPPFFSLCLVFVSKTPSFQPLSFLDKADLQRS